jgi:GT2 family glycosyltransferase
MTGLSPRVPIAAIVTAYRRIDEVLNTLAMLQQCRPAPDEILVHVDGGERACAAAIEGRFPDVRILVSEANVGPGGGRNLLVAAARHELVASFDDDSYPIDSDYFLRLAQVFEAFPAAWIVDAHVYHLNQRIEPDAGASEWVADFSGGGCAYRRSKFLETGGYVPLPSAYGMEEVDVGLRLHALGGRVLRSRRLRVFHNTDLARHADPAVTAASIANIALLAYLRYPVEMWIVAAAQCANRIHWLLRHGRSSGIIGGLLAIPRVIRAHRRERDPLPRHAVRSYLGLRRRPLSA